MAEPASGLGLLLVIGVVLDGGAATGALDHLASRTVARVMPNSYGRGSPQRASDDRRWWRLRSSRALITGPKGCSTSRSTDSDGKSVRTI